MAKLVIAVLVLSISVIAQDLPDAPSVVSSGLFPTEVSHNTDPGAVPIVKSTPFRKTADAPFWITTAASLGTSIANVELSHQCIEEHRCTLEQLPSKSRVGMYAVALPINFGASLLSYKLKKRGYRWWSVPIVALTGAQTYSLIHATTKLSE